MSAYFVDALRYEDPSDGTWRTAVNARDGEAAVVRYAFMTRIPRFILTDDGDPKQSFGALDAAGRSLVQQAMDLISSVAGVTFKCLTEAEDPEVLIGSYDIPGNVAGLANPLSNYPASPGSLSDGQVWLDTVYGVNSLAVLLHELGHVLGLKHPFEGDHLLPSAEDRHANTVMSYDWSTDPKTLMVYDVIALQSIYGPARLRRGDDVYVFGQDKVIWDGGGHDCIDARTATAGVGLSLRDGTWNHTGGKAASFLAAGQVWLGDFTIIEDALGSRFADRLTGNLSANDIKAGAGNDVLAGGGGQDDLWGGVGDDRFVFARRSDSGVLSQRDCIRDFADGDHIDLSALDLAWRGRQSFSGAGHEIRILDQINGVLLQADFNGDRTVDFAIRVFGTDQIDRGDVLL